MELKKCQANILPQGTLVTLQDWIDPRNGGQVEMIENAAGNVQTGIAEQMHQEPPAQKRNASGVGDAPWTKEPFRGRVPHS